MRISDWRSDVCSSDLRVLVRAGAEGLPVGRIQEKLAIPGSTLSHHCKRLIETGLVTQERQATTLICRARYPAMQSLIGYLADECCADSGCVGSAREVATRCGISFLDPQFQAAGRNDI